MRLNVESVDDTKESSDSDITMSTINGLVDKLMQCGVRLHRKDVCVDAKTMPCKLFIDWSPLIHPPNKMVLVNDRIGKEDPGIYELGVAEVDSDGHYIVEPCYCGTAKSLRKRVHRHATHSKDDSLSTQRITEALGIGKTVMYRMWVTTKRVRSFLESIMLFVFWYPWNSHDNFKNTVISDRKEYETERRSLQHDVVSEQFICQLEEAVKRYGHAWKTIEASQEFPGTDRTYLASVWHHLRAKDEPRASRALQAYRDNETPGELCARLKTIPWTKSEDVALCEAFVKYGRDWKAMAADTQAVSMMGNRGPVAMNTHWNAILQRKNPSAIEAEQKHRLALVVVAKEIGHVAVDSPSNAHSRLSILTALLRFANDYGKNETRQLRETVKEATHDVSWFCLLNSKYPQYYEFLPHHIEAKSAWYEMGIIPSQTIDVRSVYTGCTDSLRRRMSAYGNRGDGKVRQLSEQLNGLICPQNSNLPPIDVWIRWKYVDRDVSSILEALHLFSFDYPFNIDANGGVRTLLTSTRENTLRTFPDGYTPQKTEMTRTMRDIPSTVFRPFSASRWTDEEMNMLEIGVREHGEQWAIIKRAYPSAFSNRSTSQMAKRWHARNAEVKTTRFSKTDDDTLRRAVQKYNEPRNSRWQKMLEEFPTLRAWRPPTLCSRWKWLCKRDREGVSSHKETVFHQPSSKLDLQTRRERLQSLISAAELREPIFPECIQNVPIAGQRRFFRTSRKVFTHQRT